MRLFSINFHSESIFREINGPVQKLKIEQFNDGEKIVKIPTDLTDNEVCIICDISDEVNLFTVSLAINALRHAGAKNIYLIIPYLCYMRQDRYFPGEPISLQVVANSFNVADTCEIYIVESHSEAFKNYFKKPVHSISTMKFVSNYLSKNLNDFYEYVLVSPDKGSTKRISDFNEGHNLEVSFFSKYRKETREAVVFMESGNVKNKKCLIIDDILDSGGTLLKVSDVLIKEGCFCIDIFVVHALFTNNSIYKFKDLWEKGFIRKIYITDTINKDYSKFPFVEIISVSRLIQNLIDNLRT